MNKKIIIPIVTIITAGAIAFATIQVVNAQTKENPFSGLAEAIAQKFNLNENDIQSVINEYGKNEKVKMQAKRQEMFKTKLDALVTSGKITSTQETAILNELKTNVNPKDFKAWLESQKIDSAVIPFFGVKMRIHKIWNKNLPNPTVTPTP